MADVSVAFVAGSS